MKKLLLVLVLSSGINILPKLVYDPVKNEFYTCPIDNKINEDEYISLYFKFLQVIKNIIDVNSQMPIANDWEELSPTEYLAQGFCFLKQVGTPTALRLLEDIKENAVYFPNGEFFKSILPFEIDEDELKEMGL